MIRGLHTAASGMLAGQRRQDALINNMSNAHTVGFKEDEAALRSFPEMLLARTRDAQGLEINGTQVQLPTRIQPPIGSIAGGVYTHELIPRFSAGLIQRTEQALDVAIERDALNLVDGRTATLLFAVQNQNGDTYYTRDGRWTVNDAGELATYSGARILDVDNNPILVAGYHVEIDPSGRVRLIDPNDPDNIDEYQLGLVMIENPSATLVKGENGYFRTADGAALPLIEPDDPDMADWQYMITQGAIEGSNMNVTRTMTQMIETMRYYEANQKVLQATDRTLEKAVTEIGRV